MAAVGAGAAKGLLVAHSVEFPLKIALSIDKTSPTHLSFGSSAGSN